MDILIATSFMSGGSSLDTEQSSSNDYDTIHEIVFVAEVGLVRNKEHKQIHASPDFLLLIEDPDGEGVIYPAFCEVKTRTKTHTAFPEKKLMPNRQKFVSTTSWNTGVYVIHQ